ncbi:uncharacterized protein F4812DRAFT_467700 [Daldinia caldariorum]|uniref:uncharacterized protein n=1 Tax=Daldinia caldariorum TaxID=326644 RepID=UPI002008490E|nr:uncharacterized protein F4812DRAFT_467700 [Daldinia caldariorum]KAI1471737.1 hypothetical protein F4812DRAFT_467700 [Daldinia caldariorum]
MASRSGSQRPKVKPTADENHRVIQSVRRERHRHNAEMRRVRAKVSSLEAEQDNLWVENKQLQEVLDHLPDQTSMDEYVARIDALQDENDLLQEEIWKLKGLSTDQVKELRGEDLPTHPRNSITPEEIAVEYRNFIDQIMNLIYSWVKPLLENERWAQKVVETAQKDGSSAALVRWLDAYPDIARLSSFHVSTEYVLLASIIRWVDQHVFRAELPGVAPELLALLARVEDSLDNHVTPRQRALELRRWRQTTYFALVHHPEYKGARFAREAALGEALRGILAFLPAVRDGGAEVLQQLRDIVVFPALELNELFVTSTDHFQLQIWDFLSRNNGSSSGGGGGGGSGGEETATTVEQLWEYRDWIELEDALDNNSTKVTIADKSVEEAARRLDPVCTVVPAVVLTSADDFDDVTLCCRAYIIAAWGLPQARERKWNEQVPGFLNGFLAS